MENKPLSKKSIIWLSIVGVLFIFCVLNAFSGSSSTPSTPPDTHVGLGQQGFLRTSVGSTTAVGITKDSYDAYFKTLSANDEIGYYQLLNSGQIFNVPNGAKVLVIDTSWGYDEIRFMDGTNVGKTGWVEYEWIKEN